MQQLQTITTLVIFKNGSSYLTPNIPYKSLFTNLYIYRTQQQDYSGFATIFYRPQINLTAVVAQKVTPF